MVPFSRVARSLVVAALVAAAPVAVAQEVVPLGTKHVLTSTVLGEERTVSVCLPADYALSTSRYPVLVATDADSTWAHTCTTTAFLAKSGRAPELIVVGIHNTKRARDLVPYPARDPLYAERAPDAGGADTFAAFLETELLPWVDRTFRTAPYRVFAGHSHGGLFATHLLTTKPGLFPAIFAISPSVHWNERQAVDALDRMLKGRKELRGFFFVAVGTEGKLLESGVDALEKVLRKRSTKHLRYAVVRLPAEDHTSIVLKAHYRALEELFRGWRVPEEPKDGAIKGGLAGLRRHVDGLSARFGYPVEAPLWALSQAAAAEAKRGRFDVVKEVFEGLRVTRPNDPAPLHDWADALKEGGRPEEALPLIEEAIRLAREHKHPSLPHYEDDRVRLRTEVSKRAPPAK